MGPQRAAPPSHPAGRRSAAYRPRPAPRGILGVRAGNRAAARRLRAGEGAPARRTALRALWGGVTTTKKAKQEGNHHQNEKRSKAERNGVGKTRAPKKI